MKKAARLGYSAYTWWYAETQAPSWLISLSEASWDDLDNRYCDAELISSRGLYMEGPA